MSLYIAGTGSAVPDTIVKNNDFAKIVETSDEWIVTRTGIKERHFVNDVPLSELAVKAAKQALDQAQVLPEAIDMIIGSTMNGDYISPSMACMVQAGIGANGIALDINAACTGFLYALDLADSYFAAGKAETALIVCAEQMSKYLDYQDRSTCVLFGDGAAAVVVKKGEGLKYIKIMAQGDKTNLSITSHIKKFPCVLIDKSQDNDEQICSNDAVEVKDGSLHMNGQEIFRFAVSTSTKGLSEMMEKTEVSADDIDYYLLHQANGRIIDSVRSWLKADKSKFVTNLERYGNTSCVSIPLLLDELNRKGVLKDGALLAMSAFGAGLTAGTALVQWRG